MSTVCLISVSLSILCLLLGCVVAGAGTNYFDYIVVGAGPGGLQLGYFLQQNNRNYIILERNNVSGSFFSTYPRHDMLISINKRHTGKINKEFNLRHDWNSLISHDDSLLFKHYSKEFFPDRRDMLRYLDDYQRKLGIQVQFNTEVRNIHKKDDLTSGESYFHMNDQLGNHFICKTLVLATGLGKPNIPKFNGSEYTEGYETLSTNPDDYEGQTVLILGRGNSAFEVANSIYGATNMVHMMGRSRVHLSWATHYVGDLRAVNNNLLDTYQLKSQDAVFEAPVEQLYVHRSARGRFHLTDYGSEFDNFALREEYDKVIRCLGFKFEPGVFGNDTSVLKLLQQEKKYPEIHPNYESVHVPNLFFTGTNSHGLDHKQSSGGFIHGFRYTTRALSRLLEWKNHGVPWTSTRYHVRDLLTVITKRINEVSALYQMFGGFMGDIYVFREEGNVVDFLPEVPLHLLPELETHTGHSWAPMIVVSLEYGPDFSGPGKDVFRGDRATGEPSEAHTSNFLHPVYYYYESSPTKQDFERKQKQKKKYKYYNLPQPKRIHFTIEDFLTLWDAEKSHILPLRRFIENILETDLRNHFAEECMKMALVFSNVPYKCNQFLEGQGILGTNALVEAAFKSGLMLS